MYDDQNDKAMVRSEAPAAEVGMSVVSADQFGHIEARIRADAQVRALMARANPRDLDVVRERMLKHAARPRFAEAAEYAVPRGGTTIRGASIRFVESLLQSLGNVYADVVVLNEDRERRVGEVIVGDMETNQIYRQGFVVEKIIERRKLPRNISSDEVLGTRTGADGQTLYKFEAPESEVLMKQGALTSKIIRTLGLRLAPADIVEEALERCAATRKNQDAQDPGAALRRMADSFANKGVSVADLKKYLGHPLEQCTATELDHLRGIYSAINEGHVSWAEATGMTEQKAEADTTAKAASKIKAAASAATAKKAPVVIDVDEDGHPDLSMEG